MKFTRQHLADMSFCYAVSRIVRNGVTGLLFVSEERGPCYYFDGQVFRRETVWEGPGGTMSIVPVPWKNGDFLAVQQFYPGFNARDAVIVHAFYTSRGWRVRKIAELPFVHRMDILERSGRRYLLCCTLCREKRGRDDWTSPGELWAAELREDVTEPLELKIIAGGMTRNHGYWQVSDGAYTSALIACDEGVFEVIPPEHCNGTWTVRNILPQPASDIAFCDIDNDGVPELAAIEPFHGDNFTVYRKTAGGYRPFYRYPDVLPFCHAVWGGCLRGEPVFIGGCREGSRELFVLRWAHGTVQREVVDTGLGPSNVTVVAGDRSDLLAVANREAGCADVYIVED